MSSLLENIQMEYKFNHNPKRAYSLITQAQRAIDRFFESTLTHKFTEEQLEDLTALCRLMNENKTFQHIREHKDSEAPPHKIDPDLLEFKRVSSHRIAKQQSQHSPHRHKQKAYKAAPPQNDYEHSKINSSRSRNSAYYKNLDKISKSMKAAKESVKRLETLQKEYDSVCGTSRLLATETNEKSTDIDDGKHVMQFDTGMDELSSGSSLDEDKEVLEKANKLFEKIIYY
mmetsp:Transcript_41282/g.36624  ORF Transcript_41282/g.36624 Transcript_41282/m.36624 type:complete len:229 (+) Transcript_41282:179-865(+)